MLGGIKRYHPRFTELTAMALALVIMADLSFLSRPAQVIDTSGFPSTAQVLNSSTQRTIRVEGYGDGAPQGADKSLQSAGGVDQSGQVGKTLQNPKSGNDIQPNSGKSTF